MSTSARCLVRRLRPGPLQASRANRISSRQARHVATATATTENGIALPGSHPLPQSAATSPSIQDPVADSHFRRDRIRDAKPFSTFLTDTFNRQHDYLRISVTERCNLRCVYCMPEEGVPLSPVRELLTTPEIVLLSSLFVAQGVTKIRLTGGEPTVRRDIVPLMQQIGTLRAHGLRELCLTTNGLSLHRKLDAMVEAGLTGVNLSLDTLDPWQFQLMTRRAGFAAVRKSIDRIIELNRAGTGIKFKINCVIMRGLNDREILPFVEMTRDEDIEVRFIEYMPFDGNKWNKGKMVSFQEMLDVIRVKHPDLHRERGHRNDTSKTYKVPGFAGRIGFITSMTHNFCGTCNRLRITSDGNLKVCLFGNAEVSLRDILRKVNQGEPIDEGALEILKQVAIERAGCVPLDETPLIAPNSKELLEVIGMAVKRKKEKHAGIGELEHMKNRPMILIDLLSQSRLRSSVQLMSMSSLVFAIPSYLKHINAAHPQPVTPQVHLRPFSTASTRHKDESKNPVEPRLTHLSPAGTAHMVSISKKTPTKRTAVAKCTVRFSNPVALALVQRNQMKKGDVLGVARVAGIMAAKRTADLIPLCHPVGITHVAVELDVVPGVVGLRDESGSGNVDETRGERPDESVNESQKGQKSQDERPPGNGGEYGTIKVTATVSCDGKTGVEMEALTAAGAAALTVYDMCKAVDKAMVIDGLRVVLKEGGKNGRYVSE